MTMKYTRIYCDVDGESHFDDVHVKLTSINFAPPASPLNMADPQETERAILSEFPANWFGDWHHAPRPQFYFQMSGELEIQVSDGETRRFSAGSLILVEDTSGKGHLTRVVGNSEVAGVFVQLSAMAGKTV
ncbi:MAG: quercetin dioxygenase-like cupin family protein [Gammaproteobacteria bacterium]|jgi:quercetin dioxygenase-like cupin family protein